jgi:lipopolysaccharide assembly protein A
MLRLVVSVPFLLFLVLFVLSNREPVAIGLWPTDVTWDVPLSIAVLIAAAVAFVFGALAAAARPPCGVARPAAGRAGGGVEGTSGGARGGSASSGIIARDEKLDPSRSDEFAPPLAGGDRGSGRV